MSNSPKVTYLSEYTAPSFLVPDVNLGFNINNDSTTVTSVQHIIRDGDKKSSLVLNGYELELISIAIDDKKLDSSEYLIKDNLLTINNVPDDFSLEVVTKLYPEKNKSLEGLYKSGNILCTQNEAEGFRRITYFMDRPDVMSVYTTTITASKTEYPVLLSNGNLVESNDIDGGRHTVTFLDPFPKPCYLFALVAGDLAQVADSFKTASGRVVKIAFYVDKGNEHRVPYALESLKRAMKWDEDKYGLECDLENYAVVAVDAFNAGAMENKGLNIFNSKYVLAEPESATDDDYQGIEGVIGHEYFHNWTGNRVTCRDWFQLTLKEGLTVFRDQEFSADMTSRAVKRISDVQELRECQFPEDAGPMSHPIRPESYIEIDNFYTATVYNKGAEVIRMIHTLIGADLFRAGIEKYFELYDGKAVTTDDFIYAMELASQRDLTQFKNWYCQSGTPKCIVTTEYKPNSKELKLTVKQQLEHFADGTEKKPFHFPLKMALLDQDGTEIPVELPDSGDCFLSPVLEVTEPEQTFMFTDIETEPIVSLLRDFSAPVRMEYEYSQDELLFLLKYDKNEFARYDASQKLLTNYFVDLVYQMRERQDYAPTTPILEVLGEILENKELDSAFVAKLLTPPTLNAIVDQMDVCNYREAYRARKFFIQSFAQYHETKLLGIYNRLKSNKYSNSFPEMAKRALKNKCLSFLGELDERYIELIYKQFKDADNMTDTISSLTILCNTQSDEKIEALDSFYKKWKNDSLVINKWFTVQASSDDKNILDTIKELEQVEAFDKQNPNKIRALYGAFSRNFLHFHREDGAGYELLAKKIVEIDLFNPSIAARLSGAFEKYPVLGEEQKKLMRKQLEFIENSASISPALYEIVSKTLCD